MSWSRSSEPPSGTPAFRLQTLTTHTSLDTWVRLTDNETVTFFTGKVELGQDIVSAIARIGADELDVSLARVRVMTADTAHPLDEGWTASSQSVATSGSAVRHAAATARAQLLGLAADRLHVPVSDLAVADGIVRARSTKETVSYWQLLGGRQLTGEVTGTAQLNPPSAHRVVGRPGPRLGIVGLVTGTTRFVADLSAHGVLHARVVRSASQHARLLDVELHTASSMTGVVKVVRDGDFLGVIALREENAERAADRLMARARWSAPKPLPDQSSLTEWLLAQEAECLEVAHGVPTDGCPDRLDPSPGAAVEYCATYSRPFQMHASLGPSAAFACWTDGALEVRTHSQGPFVLRESLAQVLQVDLEQVRVIHVVGPGCYGHNGADDAALDAAILARAVPGRPVLLKWTRAQEHGWEPYGPPAVVHVQARLDARGRLLDWDMEMTGLTHNGRPFPDETYSNLQAAWTLTHPRPRTPVAPIRAPESGLHRNATPAYQIPHRRIVKRLVTQTPLRTSTLRSLGAYANIFAIESSMDELAKLAHRDPLDFRLAHLDDERGAAVLLAAAEHAGWYQRQQSPDRGMGLGYARYKNSAAYVAVALEAAVDDRTAVVKIVRATIAADAGEIVDPAGLTNQLEGGLIQSISWTLHERVTFNRSNVTSLDWHTYAILRFSEVPAVHTILLDRPGAPFLGAGEAAQGPTVAAVANAVAAATGIRVHDLPITPDQLRRAALM